MMKREVTETVLGTKCLFQDSHCPVKDVFR